MTCQLFIPVFPMESSTPNGSLEARMSEGGVLIGSAAADSPLAIGEIHENFPVIRRHGVFPLPDIIAESAVDEFPMRGGSVAEIPSTPRNR